MKSTLKLCGLGILLGLLFPVTAVFVQCQETYRERQNTYARRKAELFPAFKYGELKGVPDDEWKQQLSRFVETGKSYTSARLKVFVYAAADSRRDSIADITSQYARYLKEKAGDSIDTLVVPYGFRKEFVAELWIISRHDEKGPDTEPDRYFDPEKFGERAEGTNKEFVEMFQSFVTKLRSDQAFQGYIINYGTPEEISFREKLVRDNLSTGGYDFPRITIVNGGQKFSALTVFWLVPSGGSNPIP